jgi:hypothetical protein
VNDAAQRRARTALRGAGLDPEAQLLPAPSNANEAWLGEGFALRVNYRGDLGRLAREAQLAACLPAAALYPGVLQYGSDGTIEWLVTRRVRGIVLARAWPTMTAAQRRRAIEELAAALKALHAVDARGLPADGDLEPPHVLPLSPLVELLREVGLDPAFEAFVRARWDAFDDHNVGLVHGDPHLENVLWDGDRVSALLDLEWSRRSYLECDLETILSLCDHPWLVVAEDYEEQARAEDYVDVPTWLRTVYPELFAHPRLHDRLAVLHISRIATLGEDGELHPRRRAQLHAVLDGTSFLWRA